MTPTTGRHRAGDERGAAALRAAAAAGPFFAIGTEPVAGAGWLPFTALLEDRDVLAGRIALARAALAGRSGTPVADLDARAAASIHFLGLVSRLVAPPLGAVAMTGVLPSVAAADISWQPVGSGPVPMAWSRVSATEAGDAATAAACLSEQVVRPLVAPLVKAFAHVSPLVLWGNVASALAGAAEQVLAGRRPPVLDPAAIVTQSMTLGPLAGAGAFDGRGGGFLRRSCCLFYRVPGAGTCGDCVLAA